MTRDAALKKIARLLGAKAYWRIGAHVTGPDRRRAYELRLADAKFNLAMLARDRADRRAALLAGDPIYQALDAETKAATTRAEAVSVHNGAGGYRFEVGTRDGLFVQPKAYGDTWEEVFAKLEAGHDK